MKTKQLFLTLLIAILELPPLRLSAGFDDTGTVYYMRGSDGLDQEVLVNGKITFISQTGSTIPGYRDAGTNFKPANQGEVLKITVDAIDLTGGNYLLLYETPIDEVRGGVSDGVDQSRYLPTGWLYKLTADNVGFTYQSTAEDGGLSFGFHSGSANGQKGFKITIESVALKDMEYVETTWISDLAQPWRGLDDAVIAGVTVKMDGGLNPLKLNDMTLDCSALQGIADKVSNLRLYESSVINDDNLVATISGNQLKVSDYTLKGGKNNFYVVADLAPNAFGELADIIISSLVVDNATRTPVSSTGQCIPVRNEVRIASVPAVYTISEATEFYDDGGKDGKISDKFEGSVTFVPSTPGNAIKVDVTKLAIFNTSSTGLNDVFKFYNGSEANEDNLIATLLKTARFVKSTASDGSMTVTLKSTTGVPADGWEAVVTEYTPGNMTLSGVSASQSDYSSTVSSLQKGVDMLTIDVQTDNNSNPLALGNVSLTAANPAGFKEVSLYAIDNTTETPARVKVAAVTPNASGFTIQADCELAEGHNQFVLVADMADNLMNGNTVSLGLTSVNVGGAEKSLDAVKQLEVKNLWLSQEGAFTVNVNGDWAFQSTPNPSNADNYNTGQIDQITTFKPATPGHVIQIDFNSFEVQYASSSYGTKSVFEIYSGDSCDENNLLWKVDSDTKASAGPGATLRSTAADGFMTVKFNPNTTYSSYTKKGWDAVVKEFRNHDMTIIGAEASLPNSSELAVAAQAQPILDFTLMTEGTLSVKKLKKINLSLENPQALSAVEVYVSTQADGASATLFGRNETPAATTAIAGEYELREGKNYFFVKIDVADDAAPETLVSAGLLSVEDAAGNVDSFENCKPEGGRVIKDMLICEQGEHTVTVSGNKMFYDDGGKDGNISSRIKATYVFVPAREGHSVTIDAREFSIGNGHMYIYSGRTPDKANILGKVTGYSTTSGPQSLTSKAEDGALTVVVEGPTGTTLKGFALELGLHEKVPYALDSTTASALSSGNVARGAGNLPLLDIAAVISGDKDASKIGNLRFSTAGTTNPADIKALHLYYTAHEAVFSPGQATLLATMENPGQDVTFDAELSTGDNGVYHFFLTADLDNAATVGNIVKASFAGLDFNGQPQTPAETSAAVEIMLQRGVSGTFTIGTSDSADFPTFKDAMASLASGLEGPVVFEVENGTYAENVTVENIKGTSTENTLTIRSKSGNRADVVIAGKYTYSDKEAALKIVATPYVNVENLSVQVGSASFENVVYVGKGSHDVSLLNLDVTADKVTSGYTGISLVRTYSSTSEAGQYNDNFTVKDCHFAGGRIGLYLASNGIVAWPQDRNYRILHNTLEGIGSKGIYVSSARQVQVCDNTIIETSPVKGYYATDFYRVEGGEISGNRIVSGNEGSTIDTNNLYFRTECTGTEASPFRVFNNEVVIIGSPSYGCRALQISNDCEGMEIAYNTFRASGTAVYLFATSGSFVPKNNRFISNIFSTTCTNDASYPVYFWNDTDAQGYEFRGNVFYSPNGHVCKNDKTVLDAEDFNVLAGNETNLYENVAFLSATDSHPAEAGCLNAGTPLDYVTVDRDGNVRDACHPTIGAYEYSTPSTDAPVLSENYPKVGTPAETSVAVATKWSMNANLYAIVKEIPAEGEVGEPTAEELLSTKGVEVQANTEYTWNFTGLTPQTGYKAWFLAVSGAGIQSEVAATEEFTTLHHIEPLTVEFDNEPVAVTYGETYTLQGMVAGGDEPYEYEWSGQDGVRIATSETADVTVTLPAYYTLKVTSADGQKAMGRVAVEPENVPELTPLVVATFDDNYLESETHIMPEEDGMFYSGSFAFYNGGMPEYDFWYGYTLSNETSADFADLDDQFHSANGGGYDSANFAVAYPQGKTIVPVGYADGAVIPGFYVNNSAYAVNSMENGDGFAKKFEKGDWFKLTARITTAEGTTNKDLIYLADMRDETPSEHYILKDWEYVDLSRFGKIQSITFNFESSDTGTYGINTPTYLCIENFGTEPDAEARALAVPEDGVDLSNHFDIDADGTRTEYSVKQTSGAEVYTVRVDNGRLYLDPVPVNAVDADPTVTAVVSMRQKGRTQYLDMTLTKDLGSGIDGADTDSSDVKVSVSANAVCVNTGSTGYSVDIYSADGMHVYEASGLNGNTVIGRDRLPSGILIVRVKTAGNEGNHRILLR